MGEASKDANDNVNALAVEVEFMELIEDSGPFPGDLECAVSAKAEKLCAETLARARAVIAISRGPRSVHSDKAMLRFDGGKLLCESTRSGSSGFELSYTVTSRLCLLPPHFETIDLLVAKLGRYMELAYTFSDILTTDDIAERNAVLLKHLDALDAKRIVYVVDEVIIAADVHPKRTRISLSHKHRTLNERLHHLVTPGTLRAWLLGEKHKPALADVKVID